MKHFLGGLYTLMLTYKREFCIFTAINTTFLVVAILLGLFIEDIRIITIGIAMVVIFTFVISMKIIDHSLAILLRNGLNRLRYLLVSASFILIWSVVNGLVLFILNVVIISIINSSGNESITIPRLTMIYGEQLSLAVNLVMDIVLIFFVGSLGMLINIMFYRYGAIGGYSTISALMILLFIAFPLEWYQTFIDSILSWNVSIFCAIFFSSSLVLLMIAGLQLKRISAMKAGV